MFLSRQDAFKSMEWDVDRLGEMLASPLGNFRRDQIQVSLERARGLMKNIDLNDSDWTLELMFGDAVVELALHRMWLARHRRIALLVARHNQENVVQLSYEALESALIRSLGNDLLVNEHRTLDVVDAETLWSHCVEALTNEWVKRGGIEMNTTISLTVTLLASVLATLVDRTTTYSYDDAGKPLRTHREDLADWFESQALALIVDRVRGKLPFETETWDGFDPLPAIEDAASQSRVAVRTARADRAEKDTFEAMLASADASLCDWQTHNHRPLVSPFGLDPDEAEAWICKWMLYMGARGARVTQYVGDGGIDVLADKYIAQVKMYTGSVGIASVREFAGVSLTDSAGRRPLFFTTGTYPASAPELADRAKMALFFFDLATGTVIGANRLGSLYAEHGFLTEL